MRIACTSITITSMQTTGAPLTLHTCWINWKIDLFFSFYWNRKVLTYFTSITMITRFASTCTCSTFATIRCIFRTITSFWTIWSICEWTTFYIHNKKKQYYFILFEVNHTELTSRSEITRWTWTTTCNFITSCTIFA